MLTGSQYLQNGDVQNLFSLGAWASSIQEEQIYGPENNAASFFTTQRQHLIMQDCNPYKVPHVLLEASWDLTNDSVVHMLPLFGNL